MAYSAMLTNEGMPQYLVELIEKDFDLQNLTIGIMGMSFKPNIDDSRSSLSYKLKNILEFKAKKVIYTDPYVSDLNIKSLAEVITNSDIIIIGVPHEVYRHLEITKPLYDLWDVTRSQNLILKFNNEA
jgi:UDP-N-acetyl-D-mannosaminuronic acid dehydrogenase